jgi:hypothetical protein
MTRFALVVFAVTCSKLILLGVPIFHNRSGLRTVNARCYRLETECGHFRAGLPEANSPQAIRRTPSPAILSASPKRLKPACLRNCCFASASVTFLDAAAFSSIASRRPVMIAAGRNAVDLNAVRDPAFSKRLGQRLEGRIDRADGRRTCLSDDGRLARHESHARMVNRRAL